MRRRKLLWQLYTSYLTIALTSILAISLYASSSLRDFYMERTAENLASGAHLIQDQVLALLKNDDLGALRNTVKKLGAHSSIRITVIRANGRVAADSKEDAANMDNHADRPEFAQAMRGRRGRSTRYSYTLDKDLMYVAIPLEIEGRKIGVLRTSVPLTLLYRQLYAIYTEVAIVALLTAVLAAGLSYWASRRIVRPLQEMKQAARDFASGKFNAKVPLGSAEELAALAESMNEMAAQIEERIDIISRQNYEQEAILSSMIEAVIAMDTDERLLIINRAAGRMLGIERDDVKGKCFQEVVRSADLQKFAAKALESSELVEGEVVLHDPEDLYLEAHGTPLVDAEGKPLGAVLILHDVTRLRRLEKIRSDFVANVSHELKTPVTSIKGFVETLINGNLCREEDAVRFLGIIAKQADRLNSIIEDLMSLSKIEKEAESDEIKMEPGQVSEAVESAMAACRINAENKNVSISLKCESDARARINAPLLEQAVINLLDNAIKYSEPGSAVVVEVVKEADEIVIRVTDRGWGIEEKHLSRIFERFYRVDKARSRKMGGTGLGLAIVKHIALAHGGGVEAASTPGRGSIFSIRIPSVVPGKKSAPLR